MSISVTHDLYVALYAHHPKAHYLPSPCFGPFTLYCPLPSVTATPSSPRPLPISSHNPSYEGTNSVRDLISSPKPHLQLSSQWGSGMWLMRFVETNKHSNLLGRCCFIYGGYLNFQLYHFTVCFLSVLSCSFVLMFLLSCLLWVS